MCVYSCVCVCMHINTGIIDNCSMPWWFIISIFRCLKSVISKEPLDAKGLRKTKNKQTTTNIHSRKHQLFVNRVLASWPRSWFEVRQSLSLLYCPSHFCPSCLGGVPQHSQSLRRTVTPEHWRRVHLESGSGLEPQSLGMLCFSGLWQNKINGLVKQRLMS